MKQVKVQVEYIPSTQGEISDITLPEGNNTSGTQSELQSVNGGTNGFVLGASSIGIETFYNTANKYNGFFSGELSGDDGETDITIVATGTDIDNFMLIFDSIAQQWATEIYVDDEKWTNNNLIFFWSGDSLNSHTIKITKWNKPYYPVRITSFQAGITIDYDSRYLSEVVRGSERVADNTLPSYGALASYGSLSILDLDKELIKLAELKLLKSGLSVKIFYGDDEIGNYIAEKWSYSYNASKATLSLTDSINTWQNMDYNGIEMQENKTAYDFYLDLISYTPSEVFIVDSSTIDFLENVKIKYLEIAEGKLIEAWNKLCNLCHLCLYKLENGDIKVVRV